MINYFKLLGITVTASDDEIKAAYKEKSKVFHPDRSTGSTEQFLLIKTARDILLDKEKKKVYISQLLDTIIQPNTWLGSKAYHVVDPKLTGDGTPDNPFLEESYKEIKYKDITIIWPI
jgi:curved DNA-binding protein CbpA